MHESTVTPVPFPGTRRQQLVDALALVRLFWSEKHDPGPFYSRLADLTVARLPYRVAGATILDIGAGRGQLTDALRERGARAIPVEIDATLLGVGTDAMSGAVAGDGTRLPFADASVDGVVCSNMLEHTPSVSPVFEEIARVLKPGGWAWVSWTNWYSPWGGHEIVPLHYLGPRLGLRTWRRLFGEPRKNTPFDGLWPTHIGSVMRTVAQEPMLVIRDAMPRYYPSQRWIVTVPLVREVLTWNCLLLIERALPGDTETTRARAVPTADHSGLGGRAGPPRHPRAHAGS